MKVTVVGSGSWGTALTILLARNGHEVLLLGRNVEEIEVMRERRENLRYLPGFVIPDSVRYELLPYQVDESELTVIAVPSTAVREVVKDILGQHPLVVLASKGLESTTGRMMTEIAAEALPNAVIGALSGPNLAIEIVRGIPTAAVSAFPDSDAADLVRNAFMCRSFRVYSADDVIGVELAGALKNVLAIGAGVSDGLGYGDNTKGALMARGLREMTRLGLSMGAKLETFMGVAGVGDLFATASSNLSRNYRVGRALGAGGTLAASLHEIGQVAEGVLTSEAALILGERQGIEMPVFRAIAEVIQGKIQPIEGVGRLMERSTPNEGFMD
ncbi:MAG: NAD(P)H-dependent glycerol-3-phosphate dehydrogenase [Fimbriimonas sp.]